MAMKLGLIDNGGANIASVKYALQRLGVEPVAVNSPETLASTDRAILPGVGAAADAMRRLQQHGLVDAIRDYQKPLLGVCLGLQLLFEHSAEGDVDCLGLLPGVVERIPSDAGVTVPHMGWNQLEIVTPHPLLDGISDADWFYFVHGYAATINAHTLASCRHGLDFAAVAGRDNVVAAQFHPERSGKSGARLLKNFLEWTA